MSKKLIIAAIAILLSLLLFSGGFLLGQSLDQSSNMNNSDVDVLAFTTFYATIDSISENQIMLVSGLPVNDINFRGEFYLTISEQTHIIWRYTDISLTDLQPGANIAVTFSGPVLESYPAQISTVDKVVLLDDEF